jgi:hypothetical protein
LDWKIKIAKNAENIPGKECKSIYNENKPSLMNE